MKVKPTDSPIDKIIMKTKDRSSVKEELVEWWTEFDEMKVAAGLCSTAAYLKTSQTWRVRQIATSIRLYANLPVYSYAGSNTSKMDETKTLPQDRPSFNLVQSATDTLVARHGQNRPMPKFLTDAGDYKQRHLAEKLNHFIGGEFYQTKTYQKATQCLKDALVTGTGCLKVYENSDHKVAIDRVGVADLYVDLNDAVNGEPTQLYQLKLMDRKKVMARFPKQKKTIAGAQNAFPDNDHNSGRSIADQIMVVEAWKLPSGKDAGDGRHAIACVNGLLIDESYDKEDFPFIFLHYNEPFRGFFGRGIAAQLFGIQMGLDRIMYTISKSIQTVGVPRVFIEEGSKVSAAAQNNEIGSIIKYRGTKPTYEVAPCNAPEMYNERTNLIGYAFQQTGISQMQAAGQKPTGLNSGEAQRVYDDISTDRQNELSRKYDQVFIDLAYKITNLAKEIAERDGKYSTVYPNKNGTKEVDLPEAKFLNDPFIIQVFNESSLPRDPAGRAQSIIERVQSGMLTLKEGRRLLGSLDEDQMDQLANASEERIFKYLDLIVEEGTYTPPDQWMNFDLGMQLTVQYYNLYVAAKLEEDKAQMLRDFWTQLNALKMAMSPPMPAMPMAPGQGAPTALPQPNVTNPMVPNTPAGAAVA